MDRSGRVDSHVFVGDHPRRPTCPPWPPHVQCLPLIQVKCTNVYCARHWERGGERRGDCSILPTPGGFFPDAKNLAALLFALFHPLHLNFADNNK